MRLDRLDGLLAFRCVAQTRSFTTAAAQLEVSPQAVSQAVRSFEQRIGVRLFHRTTRSVSLNEAGERLWLQVAAPLDDLLEATEAVQAFRDTPAGLLRLAVSRPAFSALMQPALAAFREAFPDIKLEFSFDDGFVDIVAQGLDAGVRLGDSVAQDMVSIPVSDSQPIAILGSPAYLRRKGVPRRVADLAHHDCVRFRFPGSGAVFRWELLDEGRPVEMEVQGAVTVNDAASMLACAVEGLGLAYVLERAATQHLHEGSLLRVLPGAAPVLPGFHLYHPSRRQMPLKLRCFIDFMVARRAAGKRPEAVKSPSKAGST